MLLMIFLYCVLIYYHIWWALVVVAAWEIYCLAVYLSRKET